MSGWKTVPWDGVSISDEANELEFRDQGELVSMCREPPQNTTDNPKLTSLQQEVFQSNYDIL